MTLEISLSLLADKKKELYRIDLEDHNSACYMFRFVNKIFAKSPINVGSSKVS